MSHVYRIGDSVLIKDAVHAVGGARGTVLARSTRTQGLTVRLDTDAPRARVYQAGSVVHVAPYEVDPISGETVIALQALLRDPPCD